MKYILTACVVLFSFSAICQQDYFYPEAGNFDPAIPTPEKFLGYPIGFQHTRHDKIVEYFKELDRLSDRVKIKELGYTYENRLQVTAIITSPENHSRLDEIKAAHLKRNTSAGEKDTPMVILLGYNVHGNEPSSSEAAMLTAYYLTASRDPETINWMKNMVIMVDPVYNPDGRDRHTNWANMHKGFPPSADPLDREHNEVWPGGRTNHYWFDLNRDWFLAIHPESKNRLKLFHEWRPYVMTDHHEMGTNSTFYFDPGKNSSNNPIVPSQLYDAIYPKFGEYFAGAMNKLGSQYFTKEAFDKLYPGYGSSYVNFYGGAGFLFEQASSRGHVQNTPAGPVTFAFTIRNQFVAGLTTVRASLFERESLINLRINFYKTVAAQAKANPVKGYVFGDKNDPNRTNAFINLLLNHKVEVYNLNGNISAGGKTFEKGNAFLVPVEQENYLMVRSAFERDIIYTDSIFYDASTWSLVHAFNMPHAELKTPGAKGEQLLSVPEKLTKPLIQDAYSYLIELTDYRSHRAIWQLQQAGVVTKTAFKPFSAVIDGKEKKFGYGTLIIPASGQVMNRQQLVSALTAISNDCKIDIHGVQTGYNLSGIDLGSNLAQTIKPVKAIMLMGNGVMANEAGETWHLLDQRIGMPITKVDVANIGRVQWSDYNVLIMVNGTYMFDKTVTDKIKSWVQSGGTLITFKGASEWAIRQGLAKQKLVPSDTSGRAARLNFEDAGATEGAKAIGGSIFQADLDLTSPVGFGFTDRKISVYRNGLTFLQPSKNPYTNIAVYTANPLIGGYLHKSQKKRVANSAAVLLNPEGQGRIILFADNPNFRGIWYGTNKLFLNALFFGPLTTLPQRGAFEAD